jgi:heme-degrading monooxygenase HmoA
VVTRWTDEDAYEAYRAHPAFRQAHRAIAQLPGLRIDPASRVVERYEVLS